MTAKEASINVIDSTLSDYFPLLSKFTFNGTPRQNKTYSMECKTKINNTNIKALIDSDWPNKQINSKNSIFNRKLTLRQVINIQEKANQIFKQDTDWGEKSIKLSNLLKLEFQNYIKKLNLENHNDKKQFDRILNSIIKYKNKGKIVKVIRTEDGIKIGKYNNKEIKHYFENLYHSKDQITKIENNGIFNFRWDIEGAIKGLSRSEAIRLDSVPRNILR